MRNGDSAALIRKMEITDASVLSDIFGEYDSYLKLIREQFQADTETNNSWLYRCVVANEYGSVNSKGVRLTVTGVKPAIFTQPAAKLTVPQYYAILVGEENYSGSNYLPGTLNDMKAMAGMLGGLRSKYKIKKLPDATKD